MPARTIDDAEPIFTSSDIERATEERLSSAVIRRWISERVLRIAHSPARGLARLYSRNDVRAILHIHCLSHFGIPLELAQTAYEQAQDTGSNVIIHLNRNLDFTHLAPEEKVSANEHQHYELATSTTWQAKLEKRRRDGFVRPAPIFLEPLSKHLEQYVRWLDRNCLPS